MEKNKLWEACVNFHGHACGGLMIGYQASLYALDYFGLELGPNETSLPQDEGVVCIAENDACGCDAIQSILSCTIGKGNLLFHLCGKQAFSFYHRSTGQSVRLVLKPSLSRVGRDKSLEYFGQLSPQEMFDVGQTRIVLPERAKLFSSKACSSCGETTGEAWMRIREGKPVCRDCFSEVDRFHV